MPRKKIFIVRPNMAGGGADKVTLTILENLDRSVYEIYLVLMKKTGKLIEDVPDDIKLVNCKSKNLWFFVFPLAKVLKKIKPDIVFSTCGGASIPLCLAHLITLSKSKLVVSERGRLMRNNRYLNRVLRLIFKICLYKRADIVTVVSEAVRKDVSHLLFVDNRKIHRVYNPIIPLNIEKLKMEPVNHKWFLSKEEKDYKIIIHVGRFVPEKDHKTLLRAFKELLLKTEEKARLVLLGEGPMKDDVISFVNELQISDYVWFAGFDKNVYKYFYKSDVFVLSSISEGLPGVLIQALASGMKVVSTDCPSGPSEIITESYNNGILIPMKNADLLCDAILEQLEYGLSNHQKSVEKYSIKNGLKSYLEVLQ